MGVGPAECGLQRQMQPVETDRQRNEASERLSRTLNVRWPAHHFRLDAIERHL
jgi:hypothetical protein